MPQAVHADFASFDASISTNVVFFSLTDDDDNSYSSIPENLKVTAGTYCWWVPMTEGTATGVGSTLPAEEDNIEDIRFDVGQTMHTEATASGSVSGKLFAYTQVTAYGVVVVEVTNDTDETFTMVLRSTIISQASAAATGPNARAAAGSVAEMEQLGLVGYFIINRFYLYDDVDPSAWIAMKVEAPPGGSAGPSSKTITYTVTTLSPGAEAQLVGFFAVEGFASIIPEPTSAVLLFFAVGAALVRRRA